MKETLVPILHFIRGKVNAGIILLLVTVVAMIVANSPFADDYFALFEETKISIDFKIWSLSKPLYYWINDGLMAIFFFLVGLEVKREIMIGELSTVKKALLPILAAIGGMLIPAGIFVLINYNNPQYIDGWAIPMATDIAFAMGILALLKSRVPAELKIFLTSLAIVDDIGAVLTIAVFYTGEIALTYLGISLACWLLLFLLNRLGVRNLWIYILIGILGVWYPMLLSGVHATIAGVLVAFTIPLQRKFDLGEFAKRAKANLEEFAETDYKEEHPVLGSRQYQLLENLQTKIEGVSSPLQRMEHNIHNFTLYFIMPLFAFANTGIRLTDFDFGLLFNSQLAVGVMAGLVVGKVVGIVAFVWVFQKTGVIQIPSSLTWRHILGASFLAGIGFTMSIFITDLAFHGDTLVTISKVAILLASLFAGLVGFGLLRGGKAVVEQEG